MRSARELLKLQFDDEALARPVAIKISAYGAVPAVTFSFTS